MGHQRGEWVIIVTTLLSLAWLVSFAPYAVEAQLQRVSKLKVFDADGKLVGVANLGEVDSNLDFLGVNVAFQSNGQVVAIHVTRDGFAPTGGLFFESPDTTCSGTPLMRPAISMFPFVAIGPPGMTVYGPNASATPQTISVGSRLSHTGVCSAESFSDQLVPAMPLGNLDMFTQPFSVRAK